MLKKQWTLKNLITIFQSNNYTKDIMVNDFMTSLNSILTNDEAVLLFNAIDIDNSKDISVEEI
jgi:Ca2+-binding EF-hand superfamily protein